MSGRWTVQPSTMARPMELLRPSGRRQSDRRGEGLRRVRCAHTRRPSRKVMTASVAPQNRRAAAATAFRTGCTSVGDWEMTCRISAVAVCCSSDFAELAGAVLDTLLQGGVGLLERRGRAVELVGQRFQFVAGLDRQGDGRARRRRCARRRPASSRIGTTMRRASNAPAPPAISSAQHQQGQRAQAGIDHRLLRLQRRHLDEDQPVQRRDRGVGGQHRHAREVDGVDRRALAAPRGQRRRDLRQDASCRCRAAPARCQDAPPAGPGGRRHRRNRPCRP